MKKTTLYIVGIILLVMAIVAVILAKNGTFRPVSERGPEADCFAVKDTAAIQKIFIADQRGNMVLLSKKEGAWFVNDSMPALTENVNDLLSIIRNITVVHTVQKKGQPTINEAIARRGIKVEIYQIAPKFSLFGIDFSVKERKTQVYYIGEATQTNLGNYALLEGAKIPLAACLNNLKGATVTLNRRRNWTDAIERSLSSARISKKTLESLIGAIEDSLPFWQDYLKTKANILGDGDALPFYDLFAPLPNKNPS